jgi:hypothetical protein
MDMQTWREALKKEPRSAQKLIKEQFDLVGRLLAPESDVHTCLCEFYMLLYMVHNDIKKDSSQWDGMQSAITTQNPITLHHNQ